MDKILISACLLGRKVRYDGRAKLNGDETLRRWENEGRLVPICPEVMAGLPVPRPPAEIVGGDGKDVLAGRGRISQSDGRDVTDSFVAGARQALAMATREGCRYALLTEASPSCGSRTIYDGTFTGRRTTGEGVASALLRAHGIIVFDESEIGKLDRLMA